MSNEGREDNGCLWNPGELPEGWSMEKLLGRHSSEPHNPEIANTFFRSGDIEAWGRGIQRVFQACAEAGSPEPRIEFDGRDVWVEFPFSEAYLKLVREEPGEATDRTTQEKAQDRAWLARLGNRLGERLGETEGKVLLLIRADPRISTRIMAETLGVSTTAMDKTLARLKNRGFLRRVGPARGGYWEIVEQHDE